SSWSRLAPIRNFERSWARAVLHDEVSLLQQEVQQLQQEFILLQQEGGSEKSLDYLLHIAREEAGFVAPHERVLLLPAL
ncbi:MAG: septum formation initiator family protein, partial [Myxococcota bacterium]